MTAVRAWTGSAWKVPSFKTTAFKWEKYVVPGSWNTDYQMCNQQDVIYTAGVGYAVGYNFLDGVQGWIPTAGAPGLWWETEHIIQYPNAWYTSGQSDYQYSPSFRGTLGASYYGDCNGWLRHWNGVGNWPKACVNLYMTSWNDPMEYRHQFTYVNESFYAVIPGQQLQNYPGAGFQNWTNANNVTVSRTIDVYYWNGSVWVPQNAV